MSKFLPDDISDIEQFLRERAQGHTANPDIAVYGKPAAWIAIADLITKLRAERDAAAMNMRERCAKVAETADRPGKRWLALIQTMAGSEAMRHVIVQDIRALSVITAASSKPNALCGNCDSHVPSIDDRGQICCNRLSIHYNTVTTEQNGCNRFFPDPQRWPDADHG